jgi:hypothetical protein
MALPPEFDQPTGRGLRRLDGAIDRGQARVFRVLWFMVPPGSVAWNVHFQALMASRFLADIALQALLYGVLISTAREAGSAFDAALVGTAFLLPGVLLGLWGGAIADALPKRVALGGAYLLMAALCFLIPTFFGTDFKSLLLVLFAVRVLHQVSQPSEASAVPLVASDEELASANSFLSLSSSAGEALGKALLAPVVVVLWGVDPVTVLAGLLFAFSASRVFDLKPPPYPGPLEQAPRRRQSAFGWLFSEPAAFWMLMLAAMASTINVVLGMLGPQYTKEVLDVDPANALYVFAPATIGLFVGLVIAPPAIKLFRERIVATAGFALVAASMSALGLIQPITDRWGDLLPFGIPGVSLETEMAGAIAIFLGLGMTLAAAAAQTYIGKYVPTEIHGRIFALLGVMKDGLAIVPLLTLGAVASVVGVEPVLTVAPLLLLALAFFISSYSSRWRSPPERAVVGQET